MKLGDLVAIIEDGEPNNSYIGIIRELDYEKSGYVRVYWKHMDADGLYAPKHLSIVTTPDQILKDIV